MWLYLSALSAVLLGFYDISRKHALRGNAVIPVLFFASLIEAFLLLPIIVFSRTSPDLLARIGLLIPQFGFMAHFYCFLKAIIVAGLWLLGYFSMKHLPISIVTPVGASGPAWTLVGAMLVFGERLTAFQWVAFAVLFVSYYIFSLVGSREGIVFHTNKWVIFLFLAVILGAGSGLFDKYLVHTLGLSAVGVQVWFMIYEIPVLGFTLLAFWWPSRAKHTPFEWRWSIAMIGFSLSIADVAYFKALGYQDALLSLIAAVRSGGVVISFLAGAIIFHENQIHHKALALLGILVGVLMLLFSH
ncbi:MAG: DMT family transporter [Sedimentisphaerales bacterium]|jgi:transporter family protein